MIEKVAGSDADIQMVRRDVFVVVLKKTFGWAVPNEMVCQAKHDDVIQAQAAPRVGGMSSPDLFFRNIHVFLLVSGRIGERNPMPITALAGPFFRRMCFFRGNPMCLIRNSF